MTMQNMYPQNISDWLELRVRWSLRKLLYAEHGAIASTWPKWLPLSSLIKGDFSSVNSTFFKWMEWDWGWVMAFNSPCFLTVFERWSMTGHWSLNPFYFQRKCFTFLCIVMSEKWPVLINRSSCANWKPLGKFPSHLNPALSTISPHSHIFTMDRWMQHWMKKKKPGEEATKREPGTGGKDWTDEWNCHWPLWGLALWIPSG